MNASSSSSQHSSWETDRTILRHYTSKDERAFLDLWGDPDIQRLSFIETLSPTRIEQFLKKTIELMTKGDIFFLVVEDKASHEFMGHISLDFKSSPEHDGAVVAIALKKGYRRCGFGTELMQWLVAYGFRGIRLGRMSLNVLKENSGALSMYKKVGFIIEKEKTETNSNGEQKVIICMGIGRKLRNVLDR